MVRDRNNICRLKGLGSARIFAVLTGALLSAACAPAGQPRGVDEGPTIVSLNPCIDAILVEIAAPGQVLALSHYSRDPGSSSIPDGIAARYPVTGGTAEEIIALDPDLVLASSFLPQPTRHALERAGLRIETFGSPTTIAASLSQVRAVARLAERGLEGEELVRDMTSASERRADARPIPTLLWQPGEIVPGNATLVAEMLRAKGFANHADKMGLEQADFAALETVLADPPELLLVAGDSAGQQHPLLARLANTRVETLDPRLLYCGGRTIVGLGIRLEKFRAKLP
jgi:iron complex transport system substrate-binding protein